jgi:hypothetical protein
MERHLHHRSESTFNPQSAYIFNEKRERSKSELSGVKNKENMPTEKTVTDPLTEQYRLPTANFITKHDSGVKNRENIPTKETVADLLTEQYRLPTPKLSVVQSGKDLLEISVSHEEVEAYMSGAECYSSSEE